MGNENGPRSMLGRALQRFFDVEKPQYLFLFIGSFVLFGLGYGLFKPDGTFLEELRHTETSRGLITFLVAATTVSLAIITALYAITSHLPKEDIKERISHAKEILTLLVGILGTVLGFYFGSADELSVQQIEVAEPKFLDSQLLTYVSGGTGPFRYSISYPSQDTKEKITKITGLSPNG